MTGIDCACVLLTTIQAQFLTICLTFSEFEDTEVSYFRAKIKINEHMILEMGKPEDKTEWADYKLRHMISDKLNGEQIKTIKVFELEASSSIFQELIDCLLSMVADNHPLDELLIRKLFGLDKPVEKDILDRVSKNVKKLTIGAMYDEKDESAGR